MSSLALQRDESMSRYLNEVAKYPVLSREDELQLARRYSETGDVKAAHALVVSNLRFVVCVAKRYQRYGISLMELVQEGNIGLMQAVKRFNPERGYRLITYAVWWIRAQIQEFILRTWSIIRLGSGSVRRRLFFALRAAR